MNARGCQTRRLVPRGICLGLSTRYTELPFGGAPGKILNLISKLVPVPHKGVFKSVLPPTLVLKLKIFYRRVSSSISMFVFPRRFKSVFPTIPPGIRALVSCGERRHSATDGRTLIYEQDSSQMAKLLFTYQTLSYGVRGACTR